LSTEERDGEVVAHWTETSDRIFAPDHEIQLHGTEQTSAIPKLPATVEFFRTKLQTGILYTIAGDCRTVGVRALESEYTHGDVVFFVTYEVLSHGVESVAVEFVVTLDHFHEVDENASGHVDVGRCRPGRKS
jgi:hypothetical protein